MEIPSGTKAKNGMIGKWTLIFECVKFGMFLSKNGGIVLKSVENSPIIGEISALLTKNCSQKCDKPEFNETKRKKINILVWNILINNSGQ